jgi:hypothetical protein
MVLVHRVNEACECLLETLEASIDVLVHIDFSMDVLRLLRQSREALLAKDGRVVTVKDSFPKLTRIKQKSWGLRQALSAPLYRCMRGLAVSISAR